MCGILAIINKDRIYGIRKSESVKMIQSLEYRGCDSHGYVFHSHYIDHKQKLGKVTDDELYYYSSTCNTPFDYFLGHTRWSTTSPPSIEDAQPIKTWDGLYLSHNGHVENNKDFGNIDYDTKNIGNTTLMYNDIFDKVNGNNIFLFYAPSDKSFSLIHKSNLPIYIAEDDKKIIITSDTITIPKDIKTISWYKNGVFTINKNGIKAATKDFDFGIIDYRTTDLDFQEFQPNKPDPMYSEILEQSELYKKIGYKVVPNFKNDIKDMVIVGAGSSYNSAKYLQRCILLNSEQRLDVEYSSDAMFSKDNKKVLAISQSGNTLDTIKAISGFKKENIISLTNNDYNAISILSGFPLNIDAGQEVGVAATKTFTMTCLYLLESFGLIDKVDIACFCKDIKKLFDTKITQIQEIAEKLSSKNRLMVVGGSIYYPIAMESALKLKEVSQLNADALCCGETKHGPLSLVDNMMGVIVFDDPNLNKNIRDQLSSNISEVQCRGGEVIEITPKEYCTTSSFYLQPLLSNIVCQLISYFLAKKLNLNPSLPRHLAKSITV